MKSPSCPQRFVSTLALLFVLGATASASELPVGSTTVDITPAAPVALAGQFSTRISTKEETPIVAAAVAIETQ